MWFQCWEALLNRYHLFLVGVLNNFLEALAFEACALKQLVAVGDIGLMVLVVMELSVSRDMYGASAS